MKKRILIIDDDKSLCEELEEILIDEGYHVDKVSDGKKALSILLDHNYELILLDLKIPEIDGYGILKFFLDKEINFKIIILSGSPIKSKKLILDKEKESLLNKADYFINKPFDIEKLLSKINKLLK
jgi:two-component system OmpR family response regulator